jgi:hypothetical protein
MQGMCHLSTTTRFWIAALISPIAAPVFAACADIVMSESNEFDIGQYIGVAEFSFALMLVVGLPAIYLCRRYQILTFWVLLLIGAVIGVSVGLYFDWLLADVFMTPWDIDYFFILMYAAIGTAVSVTFGIIHGTGWRVGRVGDT